MIDAQTPPDALASALAVAFPSWEDRAELAREAGLGDVQLTGDALAVWKDLVDEGKQRGRLEALIRAADARRAGWRNARWTRFLPLAGLLVVLGVVALLYRSTTPVEEMAGEDVGTARTPVEATAASEALPTDGTGGAGSPGASAEGVPDPAQPSDLSSGAPPAEVAVPKAAPTPSNAAPAPSTAPPAPAAASTAKPRPAAAAPASVAQPSVHDPVTPGNCGGKQGWAYLGQTTDVVASDAWTVTRSYNVRSDYPRRDNHYAMAPAICVLHPGDVAAIPDGPTKVDGGAFWIHIQGR